MRVFNDARIELLFLPDRGDERTICELERLRANYSIAGASPAFGVPTYASKINHAYLVTYQPFLLYAADDIQPRVGWLPHALKHLTDPTVGVLATNDGKHRLVRGGLLATHGIVRRAHVETFGALTLPGSVGGPIMNEAYRHWCCDAELSWVARRRGAFRFAPDVILKHKPDRDDPTTALGRSFAPTDKALRTQRIPAWPSG